MRALECARVAPARRVLFVLATVAFFAYAPGADAQNAPEGVKLEEVTVYGIRGSLERNLEAKRFASAVVEVITAEDIGKFPDKNVADALQRVPGVVITRNGGEGNNVSIRGLNSDLTLTQLNGNFIASTPGEPSRSFSYALLPSTMIASTEVYKSPEARLDEGGVGGTVILHTRRPLDMEKNSGVLSVEATDGDLTDGADTQFSGVYSWKNDSETFGVLAGYTRQERQNVVQSGSNERWRFVTTERSPDSSNAVNVAGEVLPDVTDFSEGGEGVVGYSELNASNIWVPQVMRTGIVEEDRDREGIQLSAQFRPTERIELGVNYFKFTLGQDSTSRFMDFPEWNHFGFQRQAGFVTGLGFDPSGTILNSISYDEAADGSQGNMIFPWLRSNFNREENESDTYDFRLSYDAYSWGLSFVGGKTEASGGPSENFDVAYYASNWPNTTAGQIENPSPFARVSYGNDSYNVEIDPAAAERILSGFGGGFDPGSSNSTFANSTQEETYFQLDFDMDVDVGIFSKFRAGVKSRSGELNRFTGNDLFLVRDAVIEEFGSIEALDLTDVERNGPLSWYNAANAGTFALPLSDILRFENNVNGGFSANQFLSVDIAELRSFLANNPDLLSARKVEDNFVYNVEEDVFAYYLQADFIAGNFRGNVGVRVVETDQFADSTDRIVDFYSALDPNDGSQVDQFDETVELASLDKSYTDVLPSLNLVWDLNDEMVLRGAFAKVIARPSYADLAEPGGLTFTSQRYVDERLIGVEQGWSGNSSNKDLEPFEADQFDVSFEWYFADASTVGAALYHKDIDNFIISLTLDDVPLTVTLEEPTTSLPAGTQNITVDRFSTSANGSDATIQGFEIFGQHNFDNGFGVYANYTQNDADLTDVVALGEVRGKASLPGTADYQFNLSGYFENEKFSVRASYNRRGDVVLALNNGMNSFSKGYQQVDVNAAYNFTGNLTLTASVINLTEEEQVSFLGEDTGARLQTVSYPGRRIYLGLNYRFGRGL